MTDEELCEALRWQYAREAAPEETLQAAERIAGILAENTVLREELAEMTATVERIRAALNFMPSRSVAETRAAVAADGNLSLRACAKKHGVGVGVVRGIRARELEDL